LLELEAEPEGEAEAEPEAEAVTAEPDAAVESGDESVEGSDAVASPGEDA